jgi:nucleoside-diphosphate-sugar epimerase
VSRILITGANGFIGSDLCRWFLERGWSDLLPKSASLKKRTHRQDDMGRVLFRPEYPLGRRAVIRGLGQEDILDERLRIPVDEREPGVLDLNHDPVPPDAN